MNRALVVSPHLDDAVLSAGQFIAGRPDVVVITMLSGFPEDKDWLSPYDEKCGFESSYDAVGIRRYEDAAALSLLGAQFEHREFLDEQYGGPPPVDGMTAALLREVERYQPEVVIGPLGLVHPDHRAVRQAVLEAELDVPLWLYEELPYRVTHPEAVTEVLSIVQQDRSLELEFIGTGPLERKLAALWCYRSQIDLPEFANIHSVLVPERFWYVSELR